MASITITVQSLLNAALYDSYTVDNSTVVSTFKTTIQAYNGVSPTWFQLVFNDTLITDETQTLAYYNIVTGSSLRSANQIGSLSTLEARQKAKLDLASLVRKYNGNSRYIYDITLLPTQFNSNAIVDNTNSLGLQQGRPWEVLAQEANILVDLSCADDLSYSGTGTAWDDVSGNKNNFTLYNNPTYTKTQPGYFTFAQNSLQFADAPTIGNLTQWSVEAWFRTSSDLSIDGSTGLKTVVTTVYDDNAGHNYGNINFCLTNFDGVSSCSNGIRTGFYNGAWHVTDVVPLTVGSWYHMVGTYDGSTMKHYSNGVLTSSVAVGSASTSNGGPVRVGRRWDGSGLSPYFFPGDIGLVRIYNGVLSATDVTTNFTQERARFGI